MTDEQKMQIKEYRSQGYGYKKIAQMMDIPESTIKSYCKRYGMGGEARAAAMMGKGSVCLNCGAPLEQMPNRKQKKFCSDKCRNKWWNNHLDQVKRKAIYSYVCPCCKKQFTAYGNANRKYCSHECYIEDRFGGRRRG